ncbi:MAG: hypothetical protein NTW34_07160 [Actinobacteria bacterium]|nr:hypothetical protein [Actinomycetota bacterium]
MSHQVTPTPTIEEAVIIAENAWRFSGRWWARPSVARRDRP